MWIMQTPILCQFFVNRTDCNPFEERRDVDKIQIFTELFAVFLLQ